MAETEYTPTADEQSRWISEELRQQVSGYVKRPPREVMSEAADQIDALRDALAASYANRWFSHEPWTVIIDREACRAGEYRMQVVSGGVRYDFWFGRNVERLRRKGERIAARLNRDRAWQLGRPADNT